jgi:hypothetical protein
MTVHSARSEPWRFLQVQSLIGAAVRAALLSGLALALTPAASLAQNLIQNPGFESGLIDWNTTGAVDTEFSGTFGIPSHSGNFYANPFFSGGTLSQTVNITQSGRYDFTFFYATEPGQTWNITSSVGGISVLNATVATNGSYLESTNIVKLPTGSAAAFFDAVYVSGTGCCTGTFGEFGLDDVSLTYVGPNALTPLLPPNAPTNPLNVAGAIDNFTNSGGTLPAAFLNLYNLSPYQLQTVLNQLDGEVAADAEFGAFEMMTQFMGFMLDPFVDGRLGGFGGAGNGGQAIGFAPESQAFLPPDVALAYASILTKAQPAPFVQHWTAWGTSYGGGNWTNGNAGTGASNVTAQTFGFAGGMDYHYSPDTIFGFALGGGGLNWGLANGNGNGRSDAFQTGVYAITRAGPAYFAGALALANHWMTTNRVALGDQLTANFDAQSYGGRLEGGYRFAVLRTLGVTPYGAVQVQDFHTPSFSENDLTGGGLGLSFATMNATDVRTEIGSRFDDPTLIAGMPVILRGRVAWAHDFVDGPALGAAFESLPGTNFTVNGAPIPHDSALASAGAELYLAPRWTLLVKFDGEFASGSQTYSGTGTVRYVW